MTKLCARGKSAAKRKFKVYPSAYANAYASKICAGKIKDPSGVKRKDFKGPKPMSKGGGADFDTSGSRIKPYGKTAKVKIEKLKPKASYNKPFYRKEAKVGMAVTAGSQSGMGRLQKSGLARAKKGAMMIIIGVGKPKKANDGVFIKKPVPSPMAREKTSRPNAAQIKYQRELKEYYDATGKKPRPKRTKKMNRGGGIAIQGMNFKGVY